MNNKILFLGISLCVSTNILYSQITVSEINKTEEQSVLKPTPYDSLKNWEDKERIGDYKQYIGLQVYLPPKSNPEMNSYTRDFAPNCLSKKPVIIPVNTSEKLAEYDLLGRPTSIYDSILTYAYKPYHYFSGDVNGAYASISSDYNLISDKYYTVIDVVYGDNLEKLWDQMYSFLWRNSRNKKIYMDREGFRSADIRPDKLFVLKDDKSGDTLFCRTYDEFILVAYFVKQKQLFQNKNLIYDDYTREEFDSRFILKYEDNDGQEKKSGKKVVIEPGSKWICNDVSLLKPSYKIYYLLNNDKGEQIALTNIKGFMLETSYLKREADKKLQYQQLIAKEKQEELQRKEKEKGAIEQHRLECINLFGQQNGELIAQGKVQINMTKEMCKYSWGVPLWTSKSTTEYGVYEDWYYWLGYSLHFVNGSLKRIEE